MMSYAPSLKVKAAAELERRRRHNARLEMLCRLPLPAFLARTKIEVPVGADTALVPFDLWPAQARILGAMQHDRLVTILKARQLGISWLACGFALWLCALHAGQPALLLSRGQLEANELVRRISLMHHAHANSADLPRLVSDNTADLAWANGSRVLSLPAKPGAGRSFTAALVILDEYAFMQWGPQTLQAVKPTIDAGGKLFIISSADGNGSAFHRFWEQARQGTSGYTPIFLPWQARPDRGPEWRNAKIVEANGDTSSVLREYPETDDEAFAAATGRILDQFSGDNVTEAADYEEGAGPVLWALDDGYAGTVQQDGTFSPDSHPRAVLLCQRKPDGRLCVFAESYAVKRLSDQHIAEVLALPYPAPDFVAHGPGAAEIRGRIHAAGLYARNAQHTVEEGLKLLNRWLGADANDWRRVLVHPRCQHLRRELVSYRRDAGGGIVKEHDHGVDGLRYLAWALRHEEAG